MAPGLLLRPRRNPSLCEDDYSSHRPLIKPAYTSSYLFEKPNRFTSKSISSPPFTANADSTLAVHNQPIKSQILYVLCYAFIVIYRWFTLVASIGFPILLYTAWPLEPPLPSWLYYTLCIFGTEVLVSAFLVIPHMYYQNRFFDQPGNIPPLSSNARWLLVKQTFHAYHPFPQKPFIPSFGASGPRLNAGGHPLHSTRHIEAVLSGFFFNANPSDIWIDNVKELLAFSFFHQPMHQLSADLEFELDSIVRFLQTKTGILLKRGYNPDIKCIRTCLDEKRYAWRSSLTYVMVTIIRLLLSVSFYLTGYSLEQSADKSVGVYLPYQYVHGRWNKPPILFIHGLTGAIYLYIPWMIYMYLKTKRPIIVISIPGVSTCLFPARPTTPDVFNSFIQQVWEKYSIPKATLIGHSIGTGFAAWCIKDPKTMQTVVANAVMVEPICFGLCFPDLAYNALYRSPANWYQLFVRYFGCREFNVTCYLYRSFWWFQHALFKSDWVALNSDPPKVTSTRTSSPSVLKPVENQQHHHSRPISGTNPEDRIAVFFGECDYMVNVSMVSEYLKSEGLHSFSVWTGSDHGIALYSVSAWADVCHAVHALSERTTS